MLTTKEKRVRQCIEKILMSKDIKKTIAYRICGMASAFLIGYVMIGSWELPTIFTVLIEGVHTGIYYLFERFWK